MLPDRVSNPGPLTYESGALPLALRGPATWDDVELVYRAKGRGCKAVVKGGIKLCYYAPLSKGWMLWSIYSKTSVAGTLMARLPRLFRTCS